MKGGIGVMEHTAVCCSALLSTVPPDAKQPRGKPIAQGLHIATTTQCKSLEETLGVRWHAGKHEGNCTHNKPRRTTIYKKKVTESTYEAESSYERSLCSLSRLFVPRGRGGEGEG